MRVFRVEVFRMGFVLVVWSPEMEVSQLRIIRVRVIRMGFVLVF